MIDMHWVIKNVFRVCRSLPVGAVDLYVPGPGCPTAPPRKADRPKQEVLALEPAESGQADAGQILRGGHPSWAKC